MRLFVAIDIPDSIRALLAQTCEQLKRAAPDARWVRPESMHLTLKFIGEQPEENVEAIKTPLAKVRGPAAVRLHVIGLTFFPYMRFPTVLAAHVQTQPVVNLPDNPLVKIVEKIDSQLAPLGIQREKRAYRVHLTVARLDPRAKHQALAAALEQGPMRADFGTFETFEFHLYRSQLQRGGAVYTKLATFPFVQNQNS
jgi:2'-5' RNA ligase